MALKTIPGWRRWMGRSGRVEFWVSMAAMVAWATLAKPIGDRFPPLLLLPTIIWLAAMTRRLNDARWRWWWTLAPAGVFLLAALVSAVVAAMTGGRVALPFFVGAGLTGVTTLAIVVCLGSAARAPDTAAVDVSMFE